MNKGNFFIYLDRATVVFLSLSIFCLPFAKAGTESFIWSAILIWMLKRAFGYKSDCFWGMFPKTDLNKTLGVLIAINALSAIFSSNFDLSFRGFFGKELKFLIIYFMLVEVIVNKKRLKIVLITIIASAVLMIFDSAVQYFRGIDFIRGYAYGRLSASFATANGFAGWLEVIIPLFLGLLLADKTVVKGLKTLLLVLAMLLTVCLLATYARGAWLGFIIGILLMAEHIIINSSPKIKLLVLTIGAGLLVALLILPQPIKSKISAMGRINFKWTGVTINARLKSTLNINEGSTPIRLHLWKEALMIVRDYPLFGCGLNTYSIIAKNYKSFQLGGMYPHNSYLQKAAETGLLGLFIFLWFVFTFFKIGLHYLNQKSDFLVLGLLSGILAFLVHAFFDTHFYSLQLVVLFWYMLGLTMAVIRLETDAHKNPGV